MEQEQRDVKEVHILGRDYAIACPRENMVALDKAAYLLDQKMRQIQGSGKIVGVERIAVMAGLNLAHELLLLSDGKPLPYDTHAWRERIVRLQQQIETALHEALPEASSSLTKSIPESPLVAEQEPEYNEPVL